MNKKTPASATLSLALSLLSLLVAVASCTMYISSIDKTNAVQETQITSINNRLDKIETKLDRLFHIK